MSRIGNKPVALPSGVEVIVAENNLVTVKGPKGELSRTFNSNMQITVEGNELTVVRPNDNKENKMLHGTTRALLNNMVVGVSEGYLRGTVIIQDKIQTNVRVWAGGRRCVALRGEWYHSRRTSCCFVPQQT